MTTSSTGLSPKVSTPEDLRKGDRGTWALFGFFDFGDDVHAGDDFTEDLLLAGVEMAEGIGGGGVQRGGRQARE